MLETLTSNFNTITPTVSTPRLRLRLVESIYRINSSLSRAQRRSRSHRSSSSSPTVTPTSYAAGKARERRSSSSSSANSDYGEVIAPTLDLAALRTLPPRLQESMLALQRERELRAAQLATQQVQWTPLPTPLPTTPLGFHPPTDDERAYARGLTQHYRETAAPRKSTVIHEH